MNEETKGLQASVAMQRIDRQAGQTIKPDDLRIDTYHASEHSGFVHTCQTAVRITHLPTGAYVESKDERSVHSNKQRCMELLPAAIQAAKPVPLAVGEFALQERAQLLARIAELEQRIKGCTFCGSDEHMTAVCPMRIDEQAREIERLKENHRRHAARLITERGILRNELAALKAQPSGVVLPERKPVCEVIGGLMRKWAEGWNDCLDEVARLNSSPGSAGEPIKCQTCKDSGVVSTTDKDHNGDHIEQRCPVCSAGAADERAAFEAAYSGEYGTPLSVLRLLREGDAYIEKPQHSDRLNSSWWMWKQARAALTTPAPNHSEQVRVPEGWVLVPLEPTVEMLSAGRGISRWQYDDAIAAAPSAGSQGGDV